MQGKGKYEFRVDRSCVAGHGFAHFYKKAAQMLSVNRLGVAYDFPARTQIDDCDRHWGNVCDATEARFRCCKALRERRMGQATMRLFWDYSWQGCRINNATLMVATVSWRCARSARDCLILSRLFSVPLNRPMNDLWAHFNAVEESDEFRLFCIRIQAINGRMRSVGAKSTCQNSLNVSNAVTINTSI